MFCLKEMQMNQQALMRLLLNNRGKGRFDVQAVDKEATVYLYEAIVATDEEAEWLGGVSAESFVKQVAALNVEIIHLRINSPGGSVFGGRAMETALRNHQAKVVAYVDGVAASAASFVAMAADEIEMSPGAFLMIHKAWAWAWGNADELLKQVGLLEKVDATLVKTYAERCGLPETELMEMMAAETWIEAHEAVEMGFADRVAQGKHVNARGGWDLSAYCHAPALSNGQSEEMGVVQMMKQMQDTVNQVQLIVNGLKDGQAVSGQNQVVCVDREALRRAAEVAIVG